MTTNDPGWPEMMKYDRIIPKLRWKWTKKRKKKLN